MNTLIVTKEADRFSDLENILWGQARKDVIEARQNGYADELFNHLLEHFEGAETVEIGEISDYLWQDAESWMRALHIFEPSDVINALNNQDVESVLEVIDNNTTVKDEEIQSFVDEVVAKLSEEEKVEMAENLLEDDATIDGLMTQLYNQAITDNYTDFVDNTIDDSIINDAASKFIKNVVNRLDGDEIANIYDELGL